MATISDVAKKAGLSVPTVSRVINNKEYVSPKTKEAVLNAIKELNYVPSTAAQQLRGRKSKVIGIIVPHITNPFFAKLVNNIQGYLTEYDYQVMIFQSDESQEKEQKFFEFLINKQIDGVIMCSRETKEEVIASNLKYGPIILCNEPFNDSVIPTVALDQYQGAYIGTEYLLQKGYKKIAYCTGTSSINDEKSMSRTKGFLDALKRHQVELNPQYVYTDQHSIQDGINLLNKIFYLDDRPDAIFSGSDELAAGFILAANRKGIKIPEEIAILGFDNQPLSELTMPAITTVNQPIDVLGHQVVMEMLKLLGKGVDYQKSKMDMSIVVRESV